MNYIVTNRKKYFSKIGTYHYCNIEDVILPKIIAIDFETTSLQARNTNDFIFAIQIGTGIHNYLFDMEFLDFELLRPKLEGKVLIGHNLTFDLGWMYQKLNFWPKEVGDTMIASMILHNGKKELNGAPYRHGFGFVMEREMGLIYDKGEQKNIAKVKLSTDRAIQYCFNDVDRLLYLHNNMMAKLQAIDAIPVYRLHRRFIKALAYMEQCGLPVSREKWKQKIELDKIELEEKEKAVIEYIAETCPTYRDRQLDLFSSETKLNINLSSSKQMILIFEGYGINVENPEDKEKKSIKKNVINKTKHPFVDFWLELQGIKHDITTYGENLLSKIENETFFTTFKPILDTARIATRREGINIMNFPKGEKTRGCFVAHPGYKMLVADYSGQENFVGADITGDEAMIASIINNADLHCAFTRVLYPELESLTDAEIILNHKDKRQASKSPRFLFSFGGNAFTLHQNEGIPLNEAIEIEKAYKELHAGIYSFGEEKLEESVQQGYILGHLGFRFYLPDWEEYKNNKKIIDDFDQSFWKKYRIGKAEYKAELEAINKKEKYKIVHPNDYKLYREHSYTISKFFKKKAEYRKLVLNNPTQSGAALMTKEATCRVFEYIVEHNHQWKSKLSAIQHDELVMEVVEDLSIEYKKVIEDSMIGAGDIILKRGLFKMQAECNIGDTWYSAKG